MACSNAGSAEAQTPKQYGVTKPISIARPAREDLQRSVELEKFLTGAGLNGSKEETMRREEVLGQLKQMDLQNTSFIVQLSRRSSIHQANTSIDTREGATIHFGGLAIPLEATRATAIPVNDMPARGQTGRHIAEVPTRRAQVPVHNKRNFESIVEVSQKMISAFDRLGVSDALIMKKTVNNGRVSVIPIHASTAPVEPFMTGKYDAEASSSRGKLSRRQKRKLNAELRTQGVLTEL